MKGTTKKEPGNVWSARLDKETEEMLVQWAAQFRFLRGKSQIIRAFIESKLPDGTKAQRSRAA